MKTCIYSNSMPKISEQPVELVERKGIGHPDTLADMIAMNFSNKYSNYALNKFGFIPHHWADKVTIVGAQSEVGYKKGNLIVPMKVFQFGRVTSSVGDSRIDIDAIFRESVHEVFNKVFGKLFYNNLVECQAFTHSSSGPDHPKEFYDPLSLQDIKENQLSPKSNDTIMLTGFSCLSPLEEMVVRVENMLNSEEFKKNFPDTGYDIKVLGARIEENVDLTICIPFIGRSTPDHMYYKHRLNEIKSIIITYLIDHFELYNVTVNLNTKDFGEFAYLTLIGTSCDKGGCGAVGRGNKYNGLITLNREMAVEAPAGKNPTHHSGRLYSEAIHRMTKSIYNHLHIENYVNLVARNGDPLEDPAFVIVKCCSTINRKQEKQIADIVKKIAQEIPRLPLEVINEDPVISHTNKPMELLKES